VCNDQCTDIVGTFFDDSEDCGSELTYAVTAVDDGLDPEDMDVFARGIVRAGYREEIRDRNVSVSDLAGYLRRDINTLYHTGHGFEGAVMTSDSMLTTDTTTFGARNVIFATCLTLQVSWARAFGPNTQTVMGYTEVSFDYVDNDAAQDFVDQLAAGRSRIEAWYLANNSIDMLSDRWAGYVREGGSIVEYSARTGRRPISLSPGSYVELGHASGIFAAREVLDDRSTYDQLFTSISIVETAEHFTEFDGGGFAALGPMTSSGADAIAIADEWIERNGGRPVDAVIDRAIPIQRRTRPENAPVTVGYAVRYTREVMGLPLRSNLVEDHITILVGPTGVISSSRFWPTLATEALESPFSGYTLEVGRATLLAADAISQARKGGGEVHLIEALPVYGTLGLNGGEGELIPAFQLRAAEGGWIIINALTGEPLL
jgi:hypothetical protein